MRRIQCVAVVALFAASVCAFSQSSPKQTSPEPQQEIPNASPPAPRGTEELPLVVRIAPSPKTQEELAQEAKAQEEKTLNERWLVGSTILLAIFTAGLALFTFKLWKSTAKLVKGAEDTAQRQLRAYVCVKGAEMSHGKTELPEAEVIFQNFGQTPAYDVRQWIHMWITEYPLKETLPTPPVDFRMAASIIPPGGHTIMVMPKEPAVPAAAVSLLGTQHGTIYIYGEVRYRDIFGTERFTKYRLMFGGAEGVRSGKMKPCDEGNEAN